MCTMFRYHAPYYRLKAKILKYYLRLFVVLFRDMYLCLKIPDNDYCVYTKMQYHSIYTVLLIQQHIPFIMYCWRHLLLFTCKQNCLQTCKYDHSLSATYPTQFHVDRCLCF